MARARKKEKERENERGRERGRRSAERKRRRYIPLDMGRKVHAGGTSRIAVCESERERERRRETDTINRRVPPQRWNMEKEKQHTCARSRRECRTYVRKRKVGNARRESVNEKAKQKAGR